MPSLRDQFQQFYMPDEEAIAVAMQTGLVAPDANVLLNLYRFQGEARDQLFAVLEKLGDRFWIPHQAEKANEVCLEARDSDRVLLRLEKLSEDRIGTQMDPDKLEAAKKEAKRRAEAGIPPGYKDKTKPDPTGDYLVWRQLMDEAAQRKLPVVFITDDRKEDWYRREHGLTLGARHELREEMMTEAGVPLLMMTTGTFLHHAEMHLNAEVSDETIAQARELPLQANVTVSGPMAWAAISRADEARLDELFLSVFRAALRRVTSHVIGIRDEDRAALEAIANGVRTTDLVTLPNGQTSVRGAMGGSVRAELALLSEFGTYTVGLAEQQASKVTIEHLASLRREGEPVYWPPGGTTSEDGI